MLFASRLCDKLGCNLSSGGYYSMIAAMFWFAASLGAINMYYHHRKSVILNLTLRTSFEAPTEPPLTESCNGPIFDSIYRGNENSIENIDGYK
jgi:hypothetical protein